MVHFISLLGLLHNLIDHGTARSIPYDVSEAIDDNNLLSFLNTGHVSTCCYVKNKAIYLGDVGIS